MSPRRLQPCKNAARHWFAYYGEVGTSAPTCRHCGAPNPRYEPDADPHRPQQPYGPGAVQA